MSSTPRPQVASPRRQLRSSPPSLSARPSRPRASKSLTQRCQCAQTCQRCQYGGFNSDRDCNQSVPDQGVSGYRSDSVQGHLHEGMGDQFNQRRDQSVEGRPGLLDQGKQSKRRGDVQGCLHRRMGDEHDGAVGSRRGSVVVGPRPLAILREARPRGRALVGMDASVVAVAKGRRRLTNCHEPRHCLLAAERL